MPCLLQDATDELDALLLSLTENLMDHTVTPQVNMPHNSKVETCFENVPGRFQFFSYLIISMTFHLRRV